MKKCANKVTQIVVTSPIGNILVEFCTFGLHSVNQDPEINDRNFQPDSRRKVEILDTSFSLKNNQNAQNCVNWLDTYFHNSKALTGVNEQQLFCTIEQTTDAPFYDRVYVALLKVPFGETVSYKELATLAGNPKATRAAGSAMANNPFQLMVPCHRVLPSPSTSGKQRVGNYSSGKKVSVKEWLLMHEGHGLKNGHLV
ncbi:methylated-DNA--protein-cysteine methyltransferase [Cloeon dipterum]|uniref:methylated-DNA--protein-cysteine methyltransferase n=1 Tax=Cloeon dipterum TaxID=197152 RepID=UPI0032204C84